MLPFTCRRPPAAWRTLALALLLVLGALALLAAGRTARAQSAPAAPILNTTLLDFKLPGTQPNGLTIGLVGPGSCGNCHVDAITQAWSGSMMANAARDPIFRAALAVANQDAGAGGELCLRCHTPNGWLSGRATPADGSALTPADLQGVSCSLCHRLAAPSALPGEAPTDAAERAHIKQSQNTLLMAGSAAYVVDREDIRRGPFPPDAATHDAAQSSLLRTALVCQTCHEIDNPTLTYSTTTQAFELNPLNQAVSLGARLFPIERTFSEWQFSAFNPEQGGVSAVAALYPGLKRASMTVDGPVTICQDCHMPLAAGPLVEDGDERSVGAHEFAGGSVRVQPAISAFWSAVLTDTLFASTPTTNAVTLGEAMLARAATLEAVRVGDVLTVTIVNNTGHKLPTGYAEGRRMWLEVRGYSVDNTLIYTAGVPTAGGGIANPARVYEIQQGISDSHAQTLGRPDLAGEGFHFILNNQIFKDNRIPPRGWDAAGYESKSMLPVGATYAAGQYWDSSAYALPQGTARVEVRLLFQSTSGEYLDFLEQAADLPVADGVVGQPVNWGQTLADLRATINLAQPVVMAATTLALPDAFTSIVYLPAVLQP